MCPNFSWIQNEQLETKIFDAVTNYPDAVLYFCWHGTFVFVSGWRSCLQVLSMMPLRTVNMKTCSNRSPCNLKAERFTLLWNRFWKRGKMWFFLSVGEKFSIYEFSRIFLFILKFTVAFDSCIVKILIRKCDITAFKRMEMYVS